MTLVANHTLNIPRREGLAFLQVPQGVDVADNEIVLRAQTGDLVVTQDIPLAAEVVEAGCTALSPRGELHTRETVRQRLNMRDFMTQLRDTGVATGGPSALSPQDRQRFANQLDRWRAPQARSPSS
jgi:uncharacterized protein YaiI (UPF0178 family)